MFEGNYNYQEAAAKCAEDGGTLAMAADTNTYNFMFNILDTYVMQGGGIVGTFVDGSRGIMNPQSDAWWCVNTQSDCGQIMPWHFGRQGNNVYQPCVAILKWYENGVADASCHQLMAMCQYRLQ